MLLVFPRPIVSATVHLFWVMLRLGLGCPAAAGILWAMVRHRLQRQTSELKQEQNYIQEHKCFLTLFYLQCACINEFLFPI